MVPRCAETSPTKLPVIVFGHGLFGNVVDSLDSNLVERVAEENCVVIVGTNFIGLSSTDFSTVIFSANDLNRASRMVDKLAQAIVNFMSLTRQVRGPMANAPFFQVDGVSIIDPERVYYFGASLGGIMGTVFMSYEPTIKSGVLGVPGGPWALLFERSLAWPALRSAVQSSYEEPYVYPVVVALLGFLLDPYDPVKFEHADGFAAVGHRREDADAVGAVFEARPFAWQVHRP